MDKFTVAARKKISDLIKTENFESIISINNEYVYLDFKANGNVSSCKVDGFGHVTWVEQATTF